MRNERGASAVEYALMVALAVAVLVAAAWALGDVMGGVFADESCDTKQGYSCCAPERGYYDECPELEP